MTRDIEFKNILTIVMEGEEGTVRRGYYGNYYKGHMDKIKGDGGGGGRRWVPFVWAGRWGEKAYHSN